MNISILRMFLANKNKKDILIWGQVILSYILIVSTIYLIVGTGSNSIQLANNTRELYKISDNFIDDDEKNFFGQSDNVKILKELYSWLDTNNQFTYIVASKQGFYMDEYVYPDIFKEGYEHGFIYIEEQYKCLQVNQAFINYFAIKAIDGRLFELPDYNIDNEIIPIVLGYEYKTYANIGDRINFYYCNKELTGEVVGFLSAETYYNNGYNIQSLDRYIIMPALQSIYLDAPLNVQEKVFELKVYLDHCSGFIFSDISAQEIQQKITEKSLELNIVPYRVEGAYTFYLAMWGAEGEQLHALFVFASAFMVIISCLLISINTANKIHDLKKDIATFLANGLTKKSVKWNIFLYIFYLNLSGICVSSLLYLILTGKMYILPLIAITLLNVIIQLIYPFVFLNRLRINQVNGGI